MTTPASLSALGDESFISLTTFRKTGVGVPTAVWVARDGDALVVTTTSATGKVKRLRNNPEVQLRACNRSGKVDDSIPPTPARAVVLDDDDSRAATAALLGAKYGIQYRIFGLISRFRRSDARPSVTIRITT